MIYDGDDDSAIQVYFVELFIEVEGINSCWAICEMYSLHQVCEKCQIISLYNTSLQKAY